MYTVPFLDSFDHYNTSQMNRKWNFPGGAIGAVGRNGTNGVTTNTLNGISFGITFGAEYSAGLTAGIAYKTQAFANVIVQFINLRQSNFNCGLTHLGDGRLYLRTGSGFGVSSPVFPGFVMSSNIYYYIELFAGCRYTTGINVALDYEVRINGNVIANSFLDKGNISELPKFCQVEFGGPGGGSSAFWDDCYIFEGRTFINDVRIRYLKKNADGDLLQGTPLGGSSHYLEVDETPADDGTSYISYATGQGDLLHLEDIPGPAQIKAAQGLVLTTKSAAGDVSQQSSIKTNGSVVDFDEEFRTSFGSYIYDRQGWILNPVTGNPFTVAEINAMQEGPTRTV